MYRTLDPEKIIDTIAKLERRIVERFPGAGLSQVCAELHAVAKECKDKIRDVGEPNYVLRGLSTILMLCGVAALIYVGSIIEFKRETDNLFGVLEGIDSAFNILILMGAAGIFLWGLEARRRRERAMGELHALRSIIHVIDMHQLTKDPSKVSTVGTNTPSSPIRPLTPFELTRYLDYCSEMLSLSAKVAALYAQGSGDAIVVETASDLGQITTNMSGKIWQKIELVHRFNEIDDVPRRVTVHSLQASARSTRAGSDAN